MSIEDLLVKLDESKRELFEARFKNATHQLQDTSVFKKLRHQVAQIKTALSQKQLAS
jgi:large subunit ribosomal protein L29